MHRNLPAFMIKLFLIVLLQQSVGYKTVICVFWPIIRLYTVFQKSSSPNYFVDYPSFLGPVEVDLQSD